MYNNAGVSKLATVGFCWGAHIAAHLSTDGTMFAAGFVHYSFLDAPLLDRVTCPVALLPSRDEAPEDELVALLKAKPHGDRSVFRRFDDMPHGWCAARGNFSDPLNAQRATEALELVVGLLRTCSSGLS